MRFAHPPITISLLTTVSFYFPLHLFSYPCVDDVENISLSVVDEFLLYDCDVGLFVRLTLGPEPNHRVLRRGRHLLVLVSRSMTVFSQLRIMNPWSINYITREWFLNFFKHFRSLASEGLEFLIYRVISRYENEDILYSDLKDFTVCLRRILRAMWSLNIELIFSRKPHQALLLS